MSDSTVKTPENTPCEWYGKQVGPHQLVYVSADWKRCIYCKHEFFMPPAKEERAAHPSPASNNWETATVGIDESDMQDAPMLDPCPWCGEEPEETHANDLSYYYIGCANEDCTVQPETGLQGTPEAARREWNYKALPPKEAAGVELDLTQIKRDMLDYYEGDQMTIDVNVVADLVNAYESALAHSRSLEGKLQEVCWVYQCDTCRFVANPQHLGHRCSKCSGTCIRFATSVEAEHRAVADSNRINELASLLKKAEAELTSLREKVKEMHNAK